MVPKGYKPMANSREGSVNWGGFFIGLWASPGSRMEGVLKQRDHCETGMVITLLQRIFV